MAVAPLTLIATFGMNALTYKTERGRQDWPCAFLFPSFEKGCPDIPRCKSKRALGQMERSNFE